MGGTVVASTVPFFFGCRPSLVPGVTTVLEHSAVSKVAQGADQMSKVGDAVQNRSDLAGVSCGASVGVGKLPVQLTDLSPVRVDGCEELESEFENSVSQLAPDSSSLPDATSPTFSHMHGQHRPSVILMDTTDTYDTGGVLNARPTGKS